MCVLSYEMELAFQQFYTGIPLGVLSERYLVLKPDLLQLIL